MTTRRIPNAESTEHPWWAILDPSQMMSPDLYRLASMVTGPFFSRESAQRALDDGRHRYGKLAAVFCFSGYRSRDWREFCKEPAADPLQALRDAYKARKVASDAVRSWVAEQSENMRLVRNGDAPMWGAYVEAEAVLAAAIDAACEPAPTDCPCGEHERSRACCACPCSKGQTPSERLALYSERT